MFYTLYQILWVSPSYKHHCCEVFTWGQALNLRLRAHIRFQKVQFSKRSVWSVHTHRVSVQRCRLLERGLIQGNVPSSENLACPAHRFKVVLRLFTSHPHSHCNDLQTTLLETQRCFFLFKRFDDQRLCQWNSTLRNLNGCWPSAHRDGLASSSSCISLVVYFTFQSYSSVLLRVLAHRRSVRSLRIMETGEKMAEANGNKSFHFWGR